jgi:serine/alanine racemase
LLGQLKQYQIALPKIHIQSSYGILNYPELHCSYARIGIALYGVLSSPGNKTKIQPELRPVLSLKARVVLIRQITAGESVGYGRAFSASRNTRIAVLSIGYADGVPRSLAYGRGEVLIHGCRAPIIGRICMDQFMIDITGIHDVKRGDIATLIGEDGSEIVTAEEVAAASETITNELLSRLGSRLERVYQ